MLYSSKRKKARHPKDDAQHIWNSTNPVNTIFIYSQDSQHLPPFFDVTRSVKTDHKIGYTFRYCSYCSDGRLSGECFCLREAFHHKLDITLNFDVDYLPVKVIEFLITSNDKAEALLENSNDALKDWTIIDLLRNLTKDLPFLRLNTTMKAYLFGSRISDLGFLDSDFDISIDYDSDSDSENEHERRNLERHDCQLLIKEIAYFLSLKKETWKVRKIILHSRTPIVKVKYVTGHICDISIANKLAVENTKIIQCFNRAFPLCRKMILFLKRWLQYCGLSGSHLITSYALTWCAIFYLQTLKVFPSITKLIKLRNESRRINGWEVGITYNFPIRKINYTFQKLLLGFFRFYANFNFENYVVCPLVGEPIEKNTFTDLSNILESISLTQDMLPYIIYMQNTEERPQAFPISSLCVQDPFDLSHNLTKAISNCELEKFQTYCNCSAKVLKGIRHMKIHSPTVYSIRDHISSSLRQT
ncbi:terminal uridylyltransferase Tailor-like [Linepithema humile]|uniref:terminal uridylyltransferase Tailor-like n=1 Tax=Linepithema humile TaxID=83485 RepID=UPI000623AE83|nr:PREDICTED: speckle targeted PIP5K1A-regulated poly(A) polymerase-like [Linepithema humile]